MRSVYQLQNKAVKTLRTTHPQVDIDVSSTVRNILSKLLNETRASAVRVFGLHISLLPTLVNISILPGWLRRIKTKR